MIPKSIIACIALVLSCGVSLVIHARLETYIASEIILMVSPVIFTIIGCLVLYPTLLKLWGSQRPEQ